MSAWVLPDHIADVLPSEARHIEELRRELLDAARGYGYELVMPPLLEHLESLLTGTGHELDLRTFKLVDIHWVPTIADVAQRGMVVRHGEAFTMCEHLTVTDTHGNAVYRPTVHYAYHPSDAAINSVLELRMRRWEMQPEQRILNNEIISGRDELGVLLMGHPYKAWWTGSLLSIDEARAILPDQSATTLQVAGSIVGWRSRLLLVRPRCSTSTISTILTAEELMSAPINGGILGLNKASMASKLRLNFPLAIGY